MVILAAGTLATSLTRSGPELLAAYHGHVEAIPVTKGVRFERRRHARLFVDRFPDVGAWMRRSTPARLADLHRLKAWPFLSWCFVHRHLVPDVELLLAKPGGCGLPAEWAAHDPASQAAVAEAVMTLG